MTTYRISEDFDDTYEIDHRNGDQWIFTKRAAIQTPDIGISETFGTNVKITVAGTVKSTNDNREGILSSGVNTSMTIVHSSYVDTDTPNVSGAIGIVSTGAGASIENDGIVSGAKGGGIYSLGNDFVLHNALYVLGQIGVNSTGNNALIINKGAIGGSQYGVLLDQNTGEVSRTVNHGAIVVLENALANYVAFQGGDGNDTVINDGAMQGAIDLGKGNDIFDNRGGKVYAHTGLGGPIAGGTGDDVLITSSARYYLAELDGQGEDIIKSTVTYSLDPTYFVERLQLIGNKNIDGKGTDRTEQIWGNVGDNKLAGLAGQDSLDGGYGDDRLTGGADSDTFGFATGYGKDTITDFELGERIYITNWKAIGTLNQLKNHAEDHGANVWITAGHDTLVINHMHKADLVADDFLF